VTDKRVNGRKRHILVDTPGLMIANRVEPGNLSNRRAGALCFRATHTASADAGHESFSLPLRTAPRCFSFWDIR
jgi:hypothetical protein